MKQWALVAWAFCVACAPHRATEAESGIAARHGWRESFRYRQAVEQAVDLANRVLQPAGSLRFKPSWKNDSAGTIPVIVVDGDRLPPQHIVFVPDGEKAVVVNSDGIPTLLKYFDSPSELTWKVSTAENSSFFAPS